MQDGEGLSPGELRLVGKRSKKPPAIRLSNEKFQFSASMSEAERESMLAWQREQPLVEAAKICGHATIRDSGSYELPCQVSPYLLLARREDTANVLRLRGLGVTHILNCAATDAEVAAANAGHGPFHDDPTIQWAGFTALDMEGYELLDQHLVFARQYIDAVRLGGGRVLVHCEQAINRSAAISVAYLMLHERASLLTAVRHVRRRRGMILQNEGFVVELVRLAFVEGLADPDPAQQLASLGESPAPIGVAGASMVCDGNDGGGEGQDSPAAAGMEMDSADDEMVSPDLRNMVPPKTTRGGGPPMLFR